MIRKYIEKKLDGKDISLEVEISDTNYELLIELFRENVNAAVTSLLSSPLKFYLVQIKLTMVNKNFTKFWMSV